MSARPNWSAWPVGDLELAGEAQRNATEGSWPARIAAEQLRPVAEKAFAAALQGAVKRMLSGA